MRDFGKTYSAVKPSPTVIDEYHVTVNSNIRELVKEDPETGQVYTEYEYDSVQYDKDEYILLQTEHNSAVLENSYSAFFDGIKNTFSREKPMALTLPMLIMPNAFYSYNGKLYVGVAKGTVTEDNFRDMLEPDGLEV